ncbi:hypothetical protein CIHG_08550 [Coccidioides immitis H538.4]|uniref:Uncharacterized protein n=1 Tax=Coccidioides immitis H538.4 TaxID=396776 RepID=A0A0J8S3G8_COCIT|nr:hypothetical protein CIHG_08550 [Coccidioides immitis H538.4]
MESLIRVTKTVKRRVRVHPGQGMNDWIRGRLRLPAWSRQAAVNRTGIQTLSEAETYPPCMTLRIATRLNAGMESSSDIDVGKEMREGRDCGIELRSRVRWGG